MDPIYFMHLTKTAGGSLKSALRKSDANVAFHYPHEEGFRHGFDYPDETEIVFGHYPFGVHEIAGKEPRYACFLREPVERMISHYNHLKNNDRSPVGDHLRTFPSMRDYLLNARHWEFDNFLCRLIAGTANKPGHGNVGYNTYVQARENLTRYFEFVGIFERMDESLSHLRQIVPSLGPDLPTVNKGRYEDEPSEDDYRIIDALTRYDQMLYKDALTRFEIASASVAETA